MTPMYLSSLAGMGGGRGTQGVGQISRCKGRTLQLYGYLAHKTILLQKQNSP